MAQTLSSKDFKGSDSEGEKAEDGGLASLGGLEAQRSGRGIAVNNGLSDLGCRVFCLFMKAIGPTPRSLGQSFHAPNSSLDAANTL